MSEPMSGPMSEPPVSDARHSIGEDVVAHAVPGDRTRVQGEPPVPMDGLPADRADDVEAHVLRGADRIRRPSEGADGEDGVDPLRLA